MQYDAYSIPQGMQVILPHIPAAYFDTAGGDVIEPGDELHQGGFGGTCSPQDPHRLSRFDMKGYAG